MAEVVKMPKLSDTMTDGVIAKWHKKVGDKVKSGELLADIETDKATMEFESFQDGVLLYIGVEEKQAVPVDSVIAILGKEGEDISGLIKGGGEGAKSQDNKTQDSKPQDTKTQDDKSQEAKPAAKKTELPSTVQIVRMPKLSDTMTEGVVSKWHKKVGDKVKSGELLADIETDKATMEFESYQDGVLIHIGVDEGKSAPVDSVLAILGKGDEDVKAVVAAASEGGGKQVEGDKTQDNKTQDTKNDAQPAQQKQEAGSEKQADSNDGRVKASPLAKAMAREKGIDISLVNGTGDNGRVTRKDIENYTPSQQKASAGAGSLVGAALGQEAYTDEPASQMRKAQAKHLLQTTANVPSFSLNIEVDMDNAIASRGAINALPDTKVSFNDMVIKACAMALRRHPQVNTSWLGDKIRRYSHVHIGMAVAVEDGLLVPVIRFADQKSLSQIGAEAKELSKRARDKKLQPKEWEGNTFTVSNLGMFGIESFTSIINTPESCILSVGAIRQVPVVKNNMVVPGNTMMLTLTCDHRTVDGATGAAFLQTLKAFIENPVTMLA
jgi:pyruvate dehydrogenase E2 component (dihydrolipoamide acetyltransferase)